MNTILVLLESQKYLLIITGVSILLAIISLITAAAAAASVGRLKKRYKAMMRTSQGKDLEGLILQGQQQVDALLNQVAAQESRLRSQEERVKNKALTPMIARYNAFGEPGNDLSFSVAILDESKTGVVISSIFGREESRTYAKPVGNGHSTYTLTPEEIKVIEAAGKDESTAR